MSQLISDHPATESARSPGETPDQQQQEESLETGNRFLFFQVVPSWLVSFIIHVVLIIVLALFWFRMPGDRTVSLETGEVSTDVQTMDDLTLDSIDFGEDPLSNTVTDETNEQEITNELEVATLQETLDESVSLDTEITSSFNENALLPAQTIEQLTTHTASRSQAMKEEMLRKYGGNAASENAVRLALEWIARHQLPDGGWNFNHQLGPGGRSSPNPGLYSNARLGATAMAILPFLGAGQTQLEGDYKEVVANGLKYLIDNGRRSAEGMSFRDPQGRMYSHGLAAICLTEAYAMTQDQELALAAQEAIRFIEYAQDETGGGWRYEPKEPGDTSVVGWQVMALKSGHMGGLAVKPLTIQGANRFLESVSSESGTFYGYTNPSAPGERRKTTTSVGLLCRMYLGWTRENPALARGVEWLGRLGPSVGDWTSHKADQSLEDRLRSDENKTKYRADMYYNYYATQVMRHYGDDIWKQWNEVMRDFLISTQAEKGSAKGSWWFRNPDELGSTVGGRLYCTAMAAMTLEVYYRYMPLYDTEKTAEDEFPLD